MKRVLVITYYWPPSGGSGVQRWLKFVKYLRKFGWEPVVFTPENPEVPAYDPGLKKDVPHGIEVITQKAVEPYYWARMVTGNKESASVGFTNTGEKKTPVIIEKSIRWIRGNFFIPDARKGFVKPAVSCLSNYLKQHSLDIMVSTGPPHSMHLIGQKLHHTFNIPWIADFRDSWTGIDFYDDLLLTKWADRKHHQLEKQVLTQADAVITVSSFIRNELEQKGAKRVELITNGFDSDDINPLTNISRNDHFTLIHTGSLIPSRNPHELWNALEECCEENEPFRNDLHVHLIGKTDQSVRDSIKGTLFSKSVTFTDYKPHEQAIEDMQRADILLLPINNARNAEGFLTGKLFEYLAAGKPILCIGPVHGDAAAIIKETQSGITAHFEDKQTIKNQILMWYDSLKMNGIIPHQSKNIDQFSRIELTRKLASLLNEHI